MFSSVSVVCRLPVRGAHAAQADLVALHAPAAGTDSSATILRTFVYYMVKHPECLVKLREELDTAISEGRLSTPPTYDQTLELPYVQAVLWESIRIFPGAWPMPRAVPRGGAVISGKYFPEGELRRDAMAARRLTNLTSAASRDRGRHVGFRRAS